MFVIVGASLAGANAAETLRAEGFTGPLTMIGAEPERPYERPPLSKGYLIGNQDRKSLYVNVPDDVDLYLGTAAMSLDPAGHTVTLADGTVLGYEKLLLATGAGPKRLDVPGGDLPHVRYLRTLADSVQLRADMQQGTQVVVVGAGWIGLETAAAARHYGSSVNVVEQDRLPLRTVLGDELATVFRDLHEAHGVMFHFGRAVAAIEDESVLLDDGSVLAADLVIVGVGVAPNVELAQQAGLAVGNGVLVGPDLRTSDPDIFACGDVANWQHPLTGARIRVEHWENARRSGQAAARAMLGKNVSYDWIPYFFSDQYDLGMEYSGFVEPGGYDRVEFRGDVGNREFIAYWMKGERVIGGMNVNVWDVQDEIREQIAADLIPR
ncbi:NAD(P)/FAD-dependent oxidoreductase [Allorhizocola rhizosphaerae]|uniref:NAD(P)/FAD-dependent oxidoreductase n=1 Tax=Allorhizocola rhizosphaerae TaxID=1872709 RepID=UPI000E3E39EB|nr:FAD-dependent oxidoreductase [Allorhizocola rhizosphaerae]